jgi:hypothetical protein
VIHHPFTQIIGSRRASAHDTPAFSAASTESRSICSRRGVKQEIGSPVWTFTMVIHPAAGRYNLRVLDLHYRLLKPNELVSLSLK